MLDNTALVNASNYWFATITLIGLAFVAIWFVDLFFAFLWTPPWKKKMYAVFERHVFPIGFFITLFAVCGSLYYQFYLGIQPCELCWFARIFIYPQLFLFGMAWYKNDRKIFDYLLMLALVGVAIGIYHHFLQMGYNLYKPCGTGLFVDCSVPTFVEYGFVTFPLMGVVTNALTFLLSFSAKKFQK